MKKTISLTVTSILMLLVFAQVAIGQTGTEAPSTREEGTLLEISGGAQPSTGGGYAFYTLRMQTTDGIVIHRLWMPISAAAWFEAHIDHNITIWWELDSEGHKILLGARDDEVTRIFDSPSGFAPVPPAEYEGP